MTENTDVLSAWAEAFAAAQAQLPEIPKTKTAKIPTKSGGEYSYTYADLADVLAACRPILNQHGLSVAQSVTGTRDDVAVTTRIFHVEGHFEEFGPTVLPAGADSRGVGSAITYARRYGLCAALGIVPDEDDDGRAASNRPQRHIEPQYPKLTNHLKAVAAELCDGEKDRARALFDSVVGDTSVTPETADALEAALREAAE